MKKSNVPTGGKVDKSFGNPVRRVQRALSISGGAKGTDQPRNPRVWKRKSPKWSVNAARARSRGENGRFLEKQ